MVGSRYKNGCAIMVASTPSGYARSKYLSLVEHAPQRMLGWVSPLGPDGVDNHSVSRGGFVVPIDPTSPWFYPAEESKPRIQAGWSHVPDDRELWERDMAEHERESDELEDLIDDLLADVVAAAQRLSWLQGYDPRQYLEHVVEQWLPTQPKAERTRSTYRKAIIPVDLRWQVFERDNFTCRSCGSRTHLACDHIIAESKGGPTTLDNLQTLCRHCNSLKRDKPANHQLDLLTTGRRRVQKQAEGRP